MRCQHGLGALEMGVPGKDHIRVAVAAADKGPLQLDHDDELR